MPTGYTKVCVTLKVKVSSTSQLLIFSLSAFTMTYVFVVVFLHSCQFPSPLVTKVGHSNHHNKY